MVPCPVKFFCPSALKRTHSGTWPDNDAEIVDPVRPTSKSIHVLGILGSFTSTFFPAGKEIHSAHISLPRGMPLVEMVADRLIDVMMAGDFVPSALASIGKHTALSNRHGTTENV